MVGLKIFFYSAYNNDDIKARTSSQIKIGCHCCALLLLIIISLFYEGFIINYTVTLNNIQFIYIMAFHSLTYTMYTIYKLSPIIHTYIHIHTHTQDNCIPKILDIYNTIRFE